MTIGLITNAHRRAIVGSLFLAAFFAAMPWAHTADAGEPVAIVEGVRAENADVRLMDYVEAARVIDLGTSGRLILGYLRSCVRETITGGSVIVGRQRSKIRNGSVVRESVECEGGRLHLTTEQRARSGVLVLRKPSLPKGGDIP